MWGNCRTDWCLLRLLLCCAGLSLCSSAQLPAALAANRPDPVVRLDLAQLGFPGLSRMARVTDESDFSVDFIDSDHVLVTFNRRELLRRKPQCVPSHADRIVHAAVVHLSTGAIRAQSDWYLHDRRRYLWSLGSGRFLLRKLNSLYEVDASLNERLLLDFPDGLLWVSTTSDGSQIIVERHDWEADLLQRPKKGATDRPRVRIEFIDSHSLEVDRVLHVEGAVGLQAAASGFADATRLKRDTWLIRFGLTVTNRANVARVKTPCTPEVLHPDNTTLLIGRCSPDNAYTMSSYTTDGEQLWKMRWERKRIRPAVLSSSDGGRLLLSSLSFPPPVADSGNNQDEDEGPPPLDQVIEVRETASGTLVFSGTATSLLSGQNVALSPDGRRVALLNGTSLDIYALPRIPEYERDQYAALTNRPPRIATQASALPTPLAMDAVSLRLSMIDWVQSNSGTLELPAPRRAPLHGLRPAMENLPVLESD